MQVAVNFLFVMDALVDSGSSDSFIHPNLVQKLGLETETKENGQGEVMMASTSCSKKVSVVTYIHVNIQGHIYEKLELTVMEDLCATSQSMGIISSPLISKRFYPGTTN